MAGRSVAKHTAIMRISSQCDFNVTIPQANGPQALSPLRRGSSKMIVRQFPT
ncbi:hypothetical protein [Acetobacter nitrogenifigens]|uniref:hypothetical protein n=1 Tax=Acetobacter nitrogenifigens TaxID=285268 RepID=UPI00040DE427|nr:hypothetical protein [Acetobacter nitrogenifigens]